MYITFSIAYTIHIQSMCSPMTYYTYFNKHLDQNNKTIQASQAVVKNKLHGTALTVGIDGFCGSVIGCASCILFMHCTSMQEQFVNILKPCRCLKCIIIILIVFWPCLEHLCSLFTRDQEQISRFYDWIPVNRSWATEEKGGNLTNSKSLQDI